MGEATITQGTETAGYGLGGDRTAFPTTRVYTPDSPLRSPGAFLGGVARDVRAARILAWRLFVRDTSAQYRQTAFGYLWAALPAVFTALVWFALQAVGVINVKTGSVPYIAYVLTGTIFWQTFIDALNAPLKQLTQNLSMLSRVNFPTEALIGAGVAQVLFSFLIRAVVLAVVLAATSAPVKWTAPAALLPGFALIAFGTVLGILLLPLGMLYQDIQQGLMVVVAPLMFLTPVLYPASSAGQLEMVIHVNPLTAPFEVLREFLFGGIGPYMTEFGIVFGVTLFVVGFAWLVFRLSLPMLIERIQA
jgi:homopolymeric O-antigen transport system permease protein